GVASAVRRSRRRPVRRSRGAGRTCGTVRDCRCRGSGSTPARPRIVGGPASTIGAVFSTRPVPEPVGHGQETVGDYPRPPRLQRTSARLVVVLGGETIADRRRAYRVLETSHPPNYYFPPGDIAPEALIPAKGVSFCEWKGRAHYYTVQGGERVE